MFTISAKKSQVSRTVYDFFNLCGTIGGITSVVNTVLTYLLKFYSEFSFNLKAIQKIAKIRNKDKLKELNMF